MGIIGIKEAMRTKHIENLEKKINRITAENDVLRRNNEALTNTIHSYENMADRLADLEIKYKRGIQEAREIASKCKEVLAASKGEQMKYKAQMRRFLKTLK